MSNADVLAELTDLQRRVETESITIEQAGPAFERLTYLLTDVNRDVDQALRDLVNDIDLIRFGRRTANQLPAVATVLRRAVAIFQRPAP